MKIVNGILMEFGPAEKHLFFPKEMLGMDDEVENAEILLLHDIESITVEPGNPVYHSDGNCLIHTQEQRLILGCKNSVIPEGIVAIESWAFYDCALTAVTIPRSVKVIGCMAFEGSQLQSITLPASVETVYAGALSGCNELTHITVDPRNPFYRSENDCLIERRTKTLVACCNNPVIPEGVEIIDEAAFWGLFKSTSVTLPRSLRLVEPAQSNFFPRKLAFPNNSALVPDEQVQIATLRVPERSYAAFFAHISGDIPFEVIPAAPQ